MPNKKKAKTYKIPRVYHEGLEKFYDEFKDVCEDLQISGVPELLRSLANLGKPRFLEIVEQVRKGRKKKPPEKLKKEEE